jgi:LysM repeat protein
MTYTVKLGDTLYGISNQFGVSVTELASLNNIKGSLLNVGTILTIPSKSGDNPNNMFMYEVKQGDTLYGIARKYGITVNDIMKLNYFENTNLYPGQIIRIPENYFDMDNMNLPNYINYTVKPGDTLYSIARKNNISIETLEKDNALTSPVLRIGQILRIRLQSGSTQEVEECIGPDYTPPENTNYINYTVKKGDNLYNLAKKYNTSVSNILGLNNLTSSSLSIGQILKIPSNNMVNENIYVVKKGDSLYSIASKFNTSVNNIKNKNNLSSNVLKIGQKLKI